jgi:multiple sugar transport system ATP-binding protein
MDEPLGALDADFRETMRAEVKRLHIAQKATTVYVTHDQVEAMAMGDRIVVMSEAVIQQVGTPAEVYYKPANLFVARFIGSPGMNLVHGHYADGVVRIPGTDNQYPLSQDWLEPLGEVIGAEGEVVMGFRPEATHLTDEGQLAGEVYATELQGAYTMLHVNINEDSIVHIRSGRLVHYPIGATVRFDINPDMVRFFDPTTETAIRREMGDE